MTVRDHLKRIGKKPKYNSYGELAECNTVYPGGVPRGYIPHFERRTGICPTGSTITFRMSEKSKIESIVPITFAETADCSASHHPIFTLAAERKAKEAKENFCALNNLLTDIWNEISKQKTEQIARVETAQKNLILAVQDSNYINPQQYA